MGVSISKRQDRIEERGMRNAISRKGVFGRETDWSIDRRVMPVRLDRPRRSER